MQNAVTFPRVLFVDANVPHRVEGWLRNHALRRPPGDGHVCSGLSQRSAAAVFLG